MPIIPSKAPLPLASRQARAFRYTCDRLRDAPPLRAIVRSWIETAAPVDFESVPNARPAVFLVPSEGTLGIIGTGLAGRPTIRTDLNLTIGIAADGTDGADALRVWEAIERELWGNYRDRLPDLWDRGISAIRPVSPAHAPVKPTPESRFFVTTGIIAIQL